MVVAKLWLPTDEEVVLINKAAPFDEIKLCSYKNTLLMADDVLDKLYGGQTNLEELIRTLPYACIDHDTLHRRVCCLLPGALREVSIS